MTLDGGGGRCLYAGRLTNLAQGRRTAIATALRHWGISWQEHGAGKLLHIHWQYLPRGRF